MSQLPHPLHAPVEQVIAYLEYEGLRHYILPGQRLTLGSSRVCDIQLKGRGIQSHHVKIALHRDGLLWLRPLEGAMLRVGSERRVKPGAARPGEMLGLGLTLVHTGTVDPSLALQMRIGFQRLARYHRRVERALAIFMISVVLHLIIIALYLLLFLADPTNGQTPGAPPRIALDKSTSVERLDLTESEPEPEYKIESTPIEDPILENPDETEEADDQIDAEPVNFGLAGTEARDDDWLTQLGKGRKTRRRSLQGVGNGAGERLLEGAGKRAHDTSAQLRKTGLELAFVFDSTSSMGGIIAESKARMEEILLLLGTLVPGTRVGLVTYRDNGDQYVTRESKLGSGHYEMLAFLGSVSAEGGGDFPEAVEAGLARAMRWKWSKRATKLLILVGDAPPHAGADLKRATRSAKLLKRRKGKVYCLYTSQSQDTVSAFRKIAKAGGGEAFALDESSVLIEFLVRIALKTKAKEAKRILQNLEEARERERSAANTGRKAPLPALAQTLCEAEPDRVIVESWIRAQRKDLRALGPALQQRRLSKEGLFALSYILGSVLQDERMTWQAPPPEGLRPPSKGVPRSMRPWLFGSR